MTGPLFELRNVSKRFGAIHAIDDIDLTITASRWCIRTWRSATT